jgi:hypothetical protein
MVSCYDSLVRKFYIFKNKFYSFKNADYKNKKVDDVIISNNEILNNVASITINNLTVDTSSNVPNNGPVIKNISESSSNSDNKIIDIIEINKQPLNIINNYKINTCAVCSEYVEDEEYVNINNFEDTII